jgi:hypothetical protein
MVKAPQGIANHGIPKFGIPQNGDRGAVADA